MIVVRTRYLPALDEMMHINASGAAEDMLQVLKEHGYILEVGGMQEVIKHQVDLYEQTVIDHATRRAGEYLGREVSKHARVEITETDLGKEVRATVQIVRRRG